ncbi:MAG: NAD(P)-binding protein, partial [Neisseriaceae bacterium]|nr:NAD(P)-binding protein [Neisseriaceae bacterium]
MTNRNWNNETVLVIGTGISGIGAAALLAGAGATVILFDQNENITEEEIR